MNQLNESNLDDIGARARAAEAAATDAPVNVRLWTIVLLFAFVVTTVASIQLVSTFETRHAA